MITLGNQITRKQPDIIKEAYSLPAILTDEEAGSSLAKFLRYNLGFTWELLTNEIMFEYQEIFMNMWFERDNTLIVAGRGASKSYSLAMFSLLYSIFYPKNKTVLVANNFRRCKDIFGTIEKFLNDKNNTLLKQCFPTPISKQNDIFKLKCINGAEVIALPLGQGENLRGTRANVLLLDEALLISEHIQKTILQPFLTAKLDAKEQLEVKRIEDELIAIGSMKEEERTLFPNNRLHLTSSASYDFQYLFKGVYCPYINNINKPNDSGASYGVIRMSYEAVPEGTIMDESVIKAAADGAGDTPSFQREYKALFASASDSYFNYRKLQEATVDDGGFPTTELYNKTAKCILSIDPSYSQAKTSDHFGMQVNIIDEQARKITLVHSYAKAGGDLIQHFQYLHYILSSFNICFIIIDQSGTEFIDSFNESSIAKDRNINLKYITADLDSVDYVNELRSAKNQWNTESKRIVYPQRFSADTLRIMNMTLQDSIISKRVWFASRVSANAAAYNRFAKFEMPYTFLDKDDKPMSIIDHLDFQDLWVEETKKQLALIEVKSNALGTLSFDLPAHIKKSGSNNRARRDSYTCTLMANYAAKHIFNLWDSDNEIIPTSFQPFFV